MEFRTKFTMFSVLFIMLGHVYSQVNDSIILSILPPQPKFEYQDCGCKIKIDLRIFYGLYGSYGGQEVPDKDEVNKGAVTVSNKNDTNGNTKVDAEEWPVIATSDGRNEVDLMKLIIQTKGPKPDCPGDNVILEYQGYIKFWESSTKSKEITTLSFPINTLPRTIWVEAVEVSSSVRDIVITSYINSNTNPVQDVVKATAIWCKKQMVYYRDISNVPLSRIQDPEPSSIGIDNLDLVFVINDYSYWHPDNTRYGYGIFGNEMPSIGMPKYHGGRILFEFITLPLGIENEYEDLGIKMDISRRKTTNHSYRLTGNFEQKKSNDIPSNRIELPNDDPEDSGCPTTGGGCDALDEDAVPKNKELYSFDTPSFIIDGINSPLSVGLYNGYFNEYCRVSFNKDIIGEIEEGSKCSEFLDWNINFALAKTKILDNTDPYNKEKIDLEAVTNSGVKTTVPTLFQGNGNGAIVIEMYGDYDAGYRLEFDNANHQWKLTANTITASWVQDSNVSSSGPWEIIRPGWMKVNIENNNTINFSNNSILLFNSYVFNNLEIIQNFKSN